ncbi:MAG: type IV pilus assembly protein PilM [Phycisphaerae bacterium]|nr:type IV pilus assembly protein PilM [Phycisphaerae bacterium]
MASTNVCWGIEIGASAIRAVKLEATGEGGAKLLEYAVINHPKPLSAPDVNPNDILRVSLGALTSQYDLSKAAIAVSVPGHSAFARFAKLPPVEPKKVPDIVKFEAMQQIPFPLEQVEWDYQTFVSPDSPDVEVGIFAITRERVMERVQMLEDIGLVPNYVVLSPIAVYNALAHDLEFGSQTPGTIIVDVGTTSTDLVVATPGRMWVRTFPIGGHQFTEALVQQFQLSYPKAEKLKREAEDSKHARQVFQAMRPVFTDLAQDIQRSIGYYQSLNKDANLTRLIGVGSTFRLPGLRKYLKQQLGIDVYRIEEFKKLKVDGDGAAGFNDATLNLCTAYGLALQGLGLNAVGGNLMPVAVLRRSMWKEKVPYFGLAAGLAIAAGAGMFLFPMADKMGVSANLPDPIIQQTLRRATELKNEATEAGVLEGGGVNADAANMVALMERRGIFQQITRDVKSLIVAADQRAPRWFEEYGVKGATPPPAPAVSLRSFDCTYQPPKAAEEADPFASGDPSASNPDPLKIASFPRIECRLELTTAQPEPRKFAQETIERWLRAKENRIRADVPYEIVIDPRSIQVIESGKESEMASVSTARGGRGDPSRTISRRDESGRMLVGNEQEGFRQVSVILKGAEVAGGGSAPMSGAERAAEQSEAAAQNELDKEAPISPPPPPASTGTIAVTWYAVFKPAATDDAAAGENK